MEELPNLDDDVIADWLIPSSEINSKKLFKTTPEHNIYKADWFGDVLVYEPNRKSKSNSKSNTDWKEMNELRLIAHESILLFMAAIESDDFTSSAPTAFVMEMAHARSIQLRKLLHETACRCHQAQATTYQYHSTNSSGNVSPMLSCSPSPVVGSPGSYVDRFNWNLNERLRGSDARYGNLSPQTSPNHLNRSQNQRYLQNRDTPGRKYRRLDVEAKLNICQQVTNAMTYLHNKNYVHKNLTSVNIYIEQNQRVKISLIDNDQDGLIAKQPDNEPNNQQSSLSQSAGISSNSSKYASFNRTALTYLSPELIKSIRLTTDPKSNGLYDEQEDDKRKECNETHVDIDTSLKTKAADIYSFGTLMFELFAERYPFSSGELTNNKSALRSPTQRSMTSTPDSNSSKQHERTTTTPFPQTASIRSSSLTGRVFFDDSVISDNTAQFAQQNSLLNFSPQQSCLLQNHNCYQSGNNFKASAAELIYQIGSGLIEAKNLHNGLPETYIPAHVEKLISLCWSYKPEERPQFKEFSFI